MKKTFTAVVVFVVFVSSMVFAAQQQEQVDYKGIVNAYINSTLPPSYPIGIEIRDVLNTASPDWKVVVVYLKQNKMKQPVPFFVSKDGKSLVPGSMVIVDNKPIFTKKFQPEFEKITIKFSEKDRIVYNPGGQNTVFMFFDPDCPYCKQVEEKLKTYNGSYRVVLKHFPLVIHPDAKNKSIAMQSKWLKDKKMIHKDIDKEARKIVDEDISEAKKAEIMGTPFFVDADGNIITNIFAGE